MCCRPEALAASEVYLPVLPLWSTNTRLVVNSAPGAGATEGAGPAAGPVGASGLQAQPARTMRSGRLRLPICADCMGYLRRSAVGEGWVMSADVHRAAGWRGVSSRRTPALGYATSAREPGHCTPRPKRGLTHADRRSKVTARDVAGLPEPVQLRRLGSWVPPERRRPYFTSLRA